MYADWPPSQLLEEGELEFYARLFCKALLFFDTASLFGDKSGVVDNSLSGVFVKLSQ